MTLKELAAQLKPLITNDAKIKNLYLKKTVDDWIWIFDGKKINSKQVHYEIIKRNNQYCIELHFEFDVTTGQLISNTISLPDKTQWQKHQEKNALAYKTAYDPNDPNLVQDIFNGLKDFVTIMDEFYYSNIPPVSNNQTDSKSNSPMNQPLNQILYGPPGTGKTYATKALAVKIANPGFQVANALIEADQRLEISKEYQRLFDAGQIVFTTFHQSMSYEDFVEGIKPETLNNDVVYNVQPGLFKLMCEKASIKSNSNFEEVLERFKEDVINTQPFTIETGRSKFDVFYYGNVTFRINPHDSAYENPNYPASIENLLKYYQTDSIEAIYNPSYIRGIINHLYDKYGLVKYNNVTESPDKNYVLIIDEINRGNVSAIFGELITLLEADKRIGALEEIKLKLPYSKTDFAVPSNLYIIGTMNTADRSVEALDTALRRRFSFVEVMPQYDIIDREVADFNLKAILETINNRVEALLDRDHTIGHSYFIKVTDKASLIKAFKNCIIPLLQEYFYGDYDKINLVLGDGFMCKDKKNIVTFSGNNYNSGYGSTERYIFPELTEENIDSAIRKLLNTQESVQVDGTTEE